MGTKSVKLFDLAANGLFILVSIACIAPVLLVLGISLTSEASIQLQGYHFIPNVFSTEAYRYVFTTGYNLVRPYVVTATVTAVGTLLSLLFSSMLAFPISRPDFKYRGFFSFFVLFPMLFNGGLVSFYLLVTRYLHLQDNLLVLILPYVIVPFHIFILRNFFNNMPFSIVESAKIDGAGEFRIFFSFVMRLSLPGLATIGLFSTLIYWNDWYLSLLFINNRKIMSLQYMLQSVLLNIEIITNNEKTRQSGIVVPSESARMALCILAIGPIIFVYPFFQKYFVRGLTVGSVKG